MKRLAKSIGAVAARFLGPRLRQARMRRWVCDSVVPYLLDEQSLPRGLTPRALVRFGVTVLCDPYIYTHRDPYWCGTLFEGGLERYLLRHVKRGDTFIDVGCNVGQVSMAAAARVGASGTVLAFDANPRLAALTAEHAARQGLDQVRVHPFGLGRAAGRFTLRVDPLHDGGGTLRPIACEASERDSFTEFVGCEVRAADRALSCCPFTGRVCLKVDVEGYEPMVLSGMPNVLRHRVDHAIIEVTPEWIGGPDGVALLFRIMADAGLAPRALNDDGTPGARLEPRQVHAQVNVLFVRN